MLFNFSFNIFFEISNSFNVDAKIVGRVETYKGKKLTIDSKFVVFTY